MVKKRGKKTNGKTHTETTSFGDRSDLPPYRPRRSFNRGVQVEERRVTRWLVDTAREKEENEGREGGGGEEEEEPTRKEKRRKGETSVVASEKQRGGGRGVGKGVRSKYVGQQGGAGTARHTPMQQLH